MVVHDINSVLKAQLNKTSATHQFKTAKFFEHRLEYLQNYLAEVHENPDFSIFDETGRPRIGNFIRRVLAFAVAFGDREAAGEWAVRVASPVYPAFSLANGGTERSQHETLNPTAVGHRLGDMYRSGLDVMYAQLILRNSYLSHQVTEAWRDGVPYEYLYGHLDGARDARNAVEFARRNFKEGLPLEYALAMMS